MRKLTINARIATTIAFLGVLLIATGAGHTIRDIEAAISRVAKIVGEIATASQQQSDGIKEVSLAVTQMDEVTQQNAALVEENAATAASLADEAKRLSQLTSEFRVAGDGV